MAQNGAVECRGRSKWRSGGSIGTVEAQNGGLEPGRSVGKLWQIRIILMRSRIRIRFRIKVKSRIRIRIKEMRSRNPGYG
jgi:hypothetical protein